ncbi:response regulator [Dokdonella soli]|uniref:Response regulator n=1 Tax=Dokdonella soli TaxID=529810 RepID=A0ABP3TQH3_9GAMM
MRARILIIEDNAANLELIRYLLESSGYEALVATDGLEGVALARREMPDLVLCDLQMPQLDGYGVLKQLRADPICHGLPIVAVTAFSMRGDEERVLTAGFDGYLSKPIDPEIFITQIEVFLPAGLRVRHDSPTGRREPSDHG